MIEYSIEPSNLEAHLFKVSLRIAQPAALQTLSLRPDALEVLNGVRNALVPDGVCLAVEPTAALARDARSPHEIRDALREVAEKAGFSRFGLLGRGAVDIYELRR